jgi:hypothetical protein
MNTTRSIVIAATLLLAAAGALCSEEASPAETPATDESSITVNVTAPAATSTASPMVQVESLLNLSPTDRDALFASQARPDAGFDTAIYRLLNIATQLPQLPAADFDRLYRPDYETLLTTPDPYVGRPIRVDMYVYSVRRLVSGEDITPDVNWPVGTPLWQIRGYDVHGVNQQSFMIYSVTDPTDLLGPPVRVEEGVRNIYRPEHSLLSFACVFVKIFNTFEAGVSDDPDEQATQERTYRDYPLVIAWQAVDPTAEETVAGPNWRVFITSALIALLAAVGLAVFIYMNMKIRRTHGETSARPGIAQLKGYKSLRDEGYEDDLEEFLPEDEDADAIDPDLKAAVEGWKKDHDHEPTD